MKYVFLFTDPLAFLKTLLIFAAIFTAIALWKLLGLLTHRRVIADRGRTMVDILTLKCFMLTYAAASVCFLFFRSYVAILLWIPLGVWLNKKLLAHDFMAMAYFDAFPSYELHPFQKLKDYKENGPDPAVLNRKKFKALVPYDGYGLYCYAHTCLLSLVAYGGKLFFEEGTDFFGILSLVEFDCLAVFIIASLLLSLLKAQTGIGGRNSFRALLYFIVVVVIVNLLYFA